MVVVRLCRRPALAEGEEQEQLELQSSVAGVSAFARLRTGELPTGTNWTQFLDKVENKTKKFVELQAAQVRSKALADTLEIKRVFVRHVSHEIRTPLNIVMAGLELLGSWRDKMSAEMAEVVDEIKSACSVAMDILNDLLTYEKLDSNILVIDQDVPGAAQPRVQRAQVRPHWRQSRRDSVADGRH